MPHRPALAARLGFRTAAPLAAAGAVLLAGCHSSTVQDRAAAAPVARANPASENCGRLGGRLAIEKRGDGGEFGVCLFEDNRQCEEWALLRGACPPGGLKVTGLVTPAARYCVITGGLYQATAGAGTDGEAGECTFANGTRCVAAAYFDGTCSPSAAGTHSFADPFAYCAAVRDADAPDERYTGPAVPEPVLLGLVKQGLVAADAPPEFQQHATWRCMGGELYACHPGANLPCFERADASRAPAPAMVDYCVENPAAEAIPAAVTGRATVYSWKCGDGAPAVAAQPFHADARGFIAEIWHHVPPPEREIGESMARMTRVKISQNGRAARIPIDPDNVEPTRELLQSGRFEAHGISAALYEPVGLLPQILVSGEPDAVAAFVALAREMFVDTGRKHLIAISARLTQLSDSEIRELGVNLFPNSITYSGSFERYLRELWDGYISVDVNQSGAGNILVADESLGLGKALVASQVYTPNGVKAEISDVQHEPIFSVDNYGNVQTDYQDLETNIEVTPVVMEYDAAAVAVARVRLDITVKVSLISGEKRTGDITAPQYSDKSFKTTRVFPADGRTYLVGSFVSDSDINSRSGVPFLSKVPVLKYLFSQKSTTRSRSYALLTLAVSVIPDNLSSDELWRRLGGTGTPTTASPRAPDAPGQDANSVSGILDQAVAPPRLEPAPQTP